MQKEKNHSLLKLALSLAILSVAILTSLLFQQYQQIRRLDYVSARQSLWRSLRGSGPVGITQASLVQSWMTFDYINRVFALPPQYLKESLLISDARYPRLTVAEYAKSAGLALPAALKGVQSAIGSYSTSTAATSTPN